MVGYWSGGGLAGGSPRNISDMRRGPSLAGRTFGIAANPATILLGDHHGLGGDDVEANGTV